jgi:hypothetical protein
LTWIWNCTFADCDRVNGIWTWPVALSEAELSTWLAPLFGHTMNCPPEAAASLCTANGENVLWPARLSSSTVNALAPLEELELLVDDELELLEVEEELEELVLELLEEEVPPSAGGVPLYPSCPSRVIASTR